MEFSTEYGPAVRFYMQIGKSTSGFFMREDNDDDAHDLPKHLFLDVLQMN